MSMFLDAHDAATVQFDDAAREKALTEQAIADLAAERDRQDAEQVAEQVAERFPSVDWSTAYQTDFTQIDWLPGQFMERGQQVALVGDGKVGKSLFALDWAFRMAAGRSFLADTKHQPLGVLYLDRENSLRDIITRAQALGAAPNDLRNLTYKQFPSFTGSLDASAGASKELLALVDYHQTDVVVIDTVSRFIAGKENDSDTWIQLYQLVHQHLKARGIACLRLDHFGKDAERGARGNSAKSQDVDHVWELSRLNGRTEAVEDVEVIHTTLKLARTHTRTGLGEDLFTIGRKGERLKGGMWLNGRTRHLVVDNGVVAQLARETDLIVDELILRGVPKGLGRDGLKAWMKQAGMSTFSNSKMADVVKALIERQAGG